MAKASKQKDLSSKPFSEVLKNHGFRKTEFDEAHFITHNDSNRRCFKIICKVWEDTHEFECRKVPC